MSTHDLAMHYALRLGDRLIGITKALTGSVGLERAIVEADRAEHDARALRRVAQKMLEQQVLRQQQ